MLLYPRESDVHAQNGSRRKMMIIIHGPRKFLRWIISHFFLLQTRHICWALIACSARSKCLQKSEKGGQCDVESNEVVNWTDGGVDNGLWEGTGTFVKAAGAVDSFLLLDFQFVSLYSPSISY